MTPRPDRKPRRALLDERKSKYLQILGPAAVFSPRDPNRQRRQIRQGIRAAICLALAIGVLVALDPEKPKLFGVDPNDFEKEEQNP